MSAPAQGLNAGAAGGPSALLPVHLRSEVGGPRLPWPARPLPGRPPMLLAVPPLLRRLSQPAFFFQLSRLR